MSEEEIKGSVSAAKAARRAAIAVAPVPEPVVTEMIEAVPEMVEAAVEETVEVAEVVAETVTAEVETVSEAVETVSAAVEETVTEAVVEPMAEALEAMPEIVEAVAPEVVMPEIVAAGSAFAAKAALRIQALSDASTALTLGVQAASRTWLEATQSGMKLQREGLKKLAACRTPLDLMTAHGDLALKSVESVMETGQSIAKTSTKAIEDAGRALQA